MDLSRPRQSTWKTTHKRMRLRATKGAHGDSFRLYQDNEDYATIDLRVVDVSPAYSLQSRIEDHRECSRGVSRHVCWKTRLHQGGQK
jgi:hypothetical protein